MLRGLHIDLRLPSRDRPAREHPHGRLVAADAHRQAGRADAARGVPLEELLDHAVLERVEADGRQATAGAQHAVGLVQAPGQRFQLVVDHDAQRLEDAARRVAGAEAGRRRDVALDDLHQLAGGGERRRGAGAHQAARDVARVALLAVAAEDAGELVFGQRVHEVGGRDLQRRVHAHVQRRVVGVAEAALTPVELHRRHAQIHVDDVRRGVRALGQHVGEVAVVELRGAGRAARHLAEELGHAGVAVARPAAGPARRGARPPPRRGRRRRRCSPPLPRPAWGCSSSTSSSNNTGV